MGQLFGALGIADSERAFAEVQGQMLIWDETHRVFQQWNEDMEAATALFVQTTTEDHKERYELPGGGESQDEDAYASSESASVKRSGSWDVAYPIFQGGDSLSYTDVALGYLTMGQYEAHVQTILNRANNSTFKRILRPIFKNTNTAFTDPIKGALTLVPLANNDGTLYPPPYGTEAEAQQNFYLAPSYSESGISNANNPFTLIRNALEPMYGFPQGGSPIVALVNTTAVQYARALAGFDEYTNRYADPGDDITTLTGLPDLPPGMRIVGVDGEAGVVIAEWPRMPSGWMIGLHLDAPKPLKRRVDPANTNLPRGLHVWSKTQDNPYQTSRWRLREGYGVGNRIGAVVVALNGTNTYSIPTAYQ